VPRVEVERVPNAPDQRFTLSSLRMLNRRYTSRIALALSVPAFAVAAIAAPAALSATAAAQPTSPVHTSSVATTFRLTDATASTATDATSARYRSVVADRKSPRRHRRLGHNKRMAWLMMYRFHWRAKYQFRYLDRLWMRESSWNVYATNPYSGAYGIPQAVPGGKMATAGRNWRTSARVQIRWGMRYIRDRYGSPSRAWGHEAAFGWY
jgi:hypothetical protein